MRNEARELVNEVMRIIKREAEEEFNKRDWSKANVDLKDGKKGNSDTVSAATILLVTKSEAYDAVFTYAYMHEYADEGSLLSIGRRSIRNTLNYYNYRWLIVKRAISFYKRHEDVFKDSSNVTIEDLIAEGQTKLIEIADKFDESKGYKFNTFLMTCIDNEFMEYSVRHSRAIRLTKKQNRDIAKIKKRMEELMDSGKSCDDAMKEVSKEFNKSEYDISMMITVNTLPASLDFGWDQIEGNEQYLAFTMPEDIDGPLETRFEKALSSVHLVSKDNIEIYLRANGYYGKPELKKNLCQEYGYKNRFELNRVLEETRKGLAKELGPQFPEYTA